MKKTWHFWFAIVQFLGMSWAHMLNIKFLFYWCAFWTFYEVFAYLAAEREEK